jgi:hypothetical protein
MANGYKKIASTQMSGRLATTSASLWQAADHLLQIEKDHYTETYRRFYFADIESFTVRVTKRQWTLSFIFGSLVGICLFISLLNAGFVRGFFLSGAGLFMIPLVINWARGPACIVHLGTAVQREELPSVRRVKKAEKLLAALREITAQTQGVMAADLVRVKFELQNTPAGAAPPPLPGIVHPPATPPPLE